MASVIVLCSVKFPCSTKPITEDAKEANKQSRTGSTRDSLHMWQNVHNVDVKVQTAKNVKSIRRVKGHGKAKKLLFPNKKKRKERSAIVPACFIDFF